MNKENVKKIVENLIETFLLAGEISINLRKKGLTKKIKSDNTPVSNGDLEVNKIITKKLKELTSKIPIISEETSENKLMKNLKDFWLVDPIDGTYDYINGRDEFTVNAGLILDRKPVAGLIYAPAKKRMFFSYGDDHAFEKTNGITFKLEGSKKCCSPETPERVITFSIGSCLVRSFDNMTLDKIVAINAITIIKFFFFIKL